MFKNIIFFCFILVTSGNFIFPTVNDELYIDHSYNISWLSNLTDYHIYLLHQDTNSFTSNTLSTYENGDLVLDDLVTEGDYLWKVPRNLNYYDLLNHNFKLVITNTEGFSSSLTNTNNNYILSDYFSIKTNMNVTQPISDSVVIPKKNVEIQWNGFKGFIDIDLEYYVNTKWWGELSIADNVDSQIDIYNWYLDDIFNDIASYDLRIKIKEQDTGIERYSPIFNSYGLLVEKPNKNRYDFVSREGNQMNISWLEDNSNYNNFSINLLEDNNKLIRNLVENKFLNNYYLWDLEYNEYNRNYKIQVVNEDYNIPRVSNTFLINHLTTTTTSKTTTSETSTSKTTTTTSKTTTTTSKTTTTTSKTSTSTSKTTTTTSETTTSETTTTTSETTTSKTSTTNTLKNTTSLTHISTTTVQSSTTTVQSSTTTVQSSTTTVQSSTTTPQMAEKTDIFKPTIFTTTTKTNNIPIITETTQTTPYTNISIINFNSEITNIGHKYLIWIILIFVLSLLLIASFILCVKYYYSNVNKIHVINNERSMNNPVYVDANQYSMIQKCNNPVYSEVQYGEIQNGKINKRNNPLYKEEEMYSQVQKNKGVKLTPNPMYRQEDNMRISNVEYSNIYDKLSKNNPIENTLYNEVEAANNRIISNELYTELEQTSEEEI